MIRKLKNILVAVALAAIALAPALAPVPAQAAVANYAPGVAQVVVVPITLSGQRTATTAKVAFFKMPFACKLIGAGASARASGGTTPTLTVDVQLGGVTVLSAPIAVTAAAYAEGTITTSAITDEGSVTIDLAITGTNPTWDDITVLLTCVRK